MPGELRQWRSALTRALGADWTETDMQDLHSSVWAGTQGTLPNLAPTFSTVIAPALGVDPQALRPMTRYTDNSNLRTESLTGEEKGQTAQSVMGARAEAAIQELFGTVGQMMLGAADGLMKANDANADLETIIRETVERGIEPAKKMTGIWGLDERITSAYTSEAKLVNSKQQGVDLARALERRANDRSTDPYYRAPAITSPQLQTIVQAANQLQEGAIAMKFRKELTQLRKQKEALRSSTLYVGRLDALRREEEKLNMQMRELQQEQLEAMQAIEDQLSEQLDQPFRFDSFDPDDWR